MRAQLFTQTIDDVDRLLVVEREAWGLSGEHLEAPREKILRRIQSFPQGISIALDHMDASIVLGSQYAFRLDWNGDPATLGSWDDHTACGWTDKAHVPEGNTGFLVGVGVVPAYRRERVGHDLRWSQSLRVSQLLIARTLDILFGLGVRSVIGNARVPGYHRYPTLAIDTYCALRQSDGTLVDPVLRFHERMGATIFKPVTYSLDDPESLNAGCWVVYREPFEG